MLLPSVGGISSLHGLISSKDISIYSRESIWQESVYISQQYSLQDDLYDKILYWKASQRLIARHSLALESSSIVLWKAETPFELPESKKWTNQAHASPLSILPCHFLRSETLPLC